MSLLFRFGYGDGGKALEAETTVLRGPCAFHTNGNMTINGVVYPPGDPSTADGVVEAEAFQRAFDSAISDLAADDAMVERSPPSCDASTPTSTLTPHYRLPLTLEYGPASALEE